MRKLGLISSLWAVLLLFPLAGFSLGLGEIETSSFLNQPLKAEIEVFSARPGEIDDLLISLASRAAFDKAGLERDAGLSKLRFKVEKSEDGQSARILVTTKKSVKEPFLSFLVEADWAKGRLLREFTVLLDPVSFAQQAVQAETQVTADQQAVTDESATTQAAARASAVEPQTEPESPAQTVAQPIAVSSEPAATEQALPYVADDEYLTESSTEQVVVSKGDTLWAIVSKFKDDNHSMAQAMLAFQMTNPDAFGKDNINNLKVGSVLRVPDMDVMDRLSKQEAYAQVLEQNGLWDEYVARKSTSTSAATADSVTGIGSSQQQSESQLSLLTPDEGDSDSASLQNDANSENAGQIRKQLALAEEELEAARLENDDLKSRIAMLEEQQSKFEELQNLVQIKDDSLAQLQQQAATEQEVLEKTPGTGSDSLIESSTDDEKPSDVMIEAADEMLTDTADQAVETDSDSMGQMMEEVQSTEAETVIQTTEEADEMFEKESVSQPDVATVPAPVIVTEAPSSGLEGGLNDFTEMLPSIDSILNDPVMLGGLGGVLLLILGLVVLKRKKTNKVDDSITLEESSDLIDDDATPIHVPSSTQIEIPEVDELAETAMMEGDQSQSDTVASQAEEVEEEDEFASTAIISAEDMAVVTQETAAVQEEQDDVLNEVDVYLAYGLYDNAEDLLSETLKNSPDRADYRAKLLDTHFATKNKDSFVREAEMLKSLGGAADRFWGRIQTMGFELAPENELFSGAKDSGVSVEDLEYAKPQSADFDIGADEDETDFSGTDFNLSDDDSFDISTTQVIGVANDDTAEIQAMGTLDNDFPDLDESSDETQKSPLIEDLPDDINVDDLSIGDELVDNLGLDEELLESSSDELDISEETESSETDVSDDLGLIDDLDTSAELDLDLDDNDDNDDISFNLPDDLDVLVDEDDSATEIIDLDDTVEAPIVLDDVPDLDDDGIEINLSDLDIETDIEADIDEQLDKLTEDPDEINETLVMSVEDQESETAKAEAELKEVKEEVDVEIPPDDELDFDMSDMDNEELQPGDFSPSETVAMSGIDLGDDDITEFKPADSTGEFDAFIADATDEGALNEVDATAGFEKTGTFAPGDFNEEDIADLDTDTDDIEDLMLPDDVDEVATKLDLAKAFIDMGDAEGARSSLEEVLVEGTEEQKSEATGLLDQVN